MGKNNYLKRLAKSGIKPTAIRLLVLGAISNKTEIFSLLDLEAELGTIDKSTLFTHRSTTHAQNCTFANLHNHAYNPSLQKSCFFLPSRLLCA